MALSEAELDSALEAALRTSSKFAEWFLSQTKYAGLPSRHLESRCNNPWGKFPIELPNDQTGKLETVMKEGETDVLAIFEVAGKRIGLHIENKVSKGRFTPLQPKLYAARAAHWTGKPEYGMFAPIES